MIKTVLLLITVCIALVLAACATKPLDKAFKGYMEPYEETKTIVDYCQSCHVHRKHNTTLHLSSINQKYDAEPYKSAKRCATCHKMRRNWWNDIIRETHFPKGKLISQ